MNNFFSTNGILTRHRHITKPIEQAVRQEFTVALARFLEAKELADIAEVALEQGSFAAGQELIDAAYSVANGSDVQDVERVAAHVAKFKPFLLAQH